MAELGTTLEAVADYTAPTVFVVFALAAVMYGVHLIAQARHYNPHRVAKLSKEEQEQIAEAVDTKGEADHAAWVRSIQ